MLRCVAAAVLLMVGTTLPADELKLPQVPKDAPAWEASGELADLLDKMESSVTATQKVFQPLSAEQLNWRPPNGTHTPRWNAEHLTATPLRFFSQIFAAIDPNRHRVINLSPKRMPDDYTPAHPDWDGEREALRMQRVSDYVHGHAYLLEGLDLDAKAPGSRSVLRDLLERMATHPAEHTANVKKKFDLPGWPKD